MCSIKNHTKNKMETKLFRLKQDSDEGALNFYNQIRSLDSNELHENGLYVICGYTPGVRYRVSYLLHRGGAIITLKNQSSKLLKIVAFTKGPVNKAESTLLKLIKERDLLQIKEVD